MVKWSRIAGKVNVFDTGDWFYFISNDYLPWFKDKEDNKSAEKITGKYLFFHEDLKILAKIAVDEIQQNGFHVAKINRTILGNGKEHVLCLYYQDDSRKNELAQKYQGKNEIKYRYWKSDEDTRKGKYSKEFLDKLSKKRTN